MDRAQTPSWFPSDATASGSGSDASEAVSSMAVCKKSGRIVTVRSARAARVVERLARHGGVGDEVARQHHHRAGRGHRVGGGHGCAVAVADTLRRRQAVLRRDRHRADLDGAVPPLRVLGAHPRAASGGGAVQRPLKLLVATDKEVLVYDLRRRVLSYSLQAHLRTGVHGGRVQHDLNGNKTEGRIRC